MIAVVLTAQVPSVLVVEPRCPTPRPPEDDHEASEDEVN